MNYKSLILCFGTCAALISCSKEEEHVVNQTVEKIVTLRLSTPQAGPRAIEGSIGTVVPEVKSATLKFYNSSNQELGQRVLSTEDISQALDKGLRISVSSEVQKVSINGNGAIDANDILHYQGLNKTGDASAFKTKIPLISEKTEITTGATPSVVLKPKAQLARIEVSGSINTHPTDQSKQPVYEYAKVSQVFCNNYKLTYSATTPQLYTPNSTTTTGLAWESLPKKMKDPLGDNERAALSETGVNKKCAAYQVFPSTGIDALPHIILEVKYKEKGKAEKTGYFTINRYKIEINNEVKFMESMEGGYIYKLDINALSSKFQNAQDENGNVIDPTDENPEMPKSDLSIKVEPVAWIVENIIPSI